MTCWTKRTRQRDQQGPITRTVLTDKGCAGLERTCSTWWTCSKPTMWGDCAHPGTDKWQCVAPQGTHLLTIQHRVRHCAGAYRVHIKLKLVHVLHNTRQQQSELDTPGNVTHTYWLPAHVGHTPSVTTVCGCCPYAPAHSIHNGFAGRGPSALGSSTC